jgi:hypothetical protein
MYVRARAGNEKALGSDHMSTLSHRQQSRAGQGKLAEAEQIDVWALAGYEKALGPAIPPSLPLSWLRAHRRVATSQVSEIDEITVRTTI